MSLNKMRFLNMIPNVKIKKEIKCEDEELVVCRFCSKGFASGVALSNHARLEHLEQYAAGEDLCLPPQPQPPQPKLTKAQQREETKRQIKIKTEELISAMSPTDLMSFASPEVSYIIIKAEGGAPAAAATPDAGRRRERARADRADRQAQRAERPARRERDREPLPISGPFECLQPSTLVAERACHQIFFSCCEYSAHHRDEHTRRRKGLRCQVCEKPLVGDAAAAPYPCETCGVGFNTSRELSEHTSAAHVKLKPFQCTVCSKRFTQQGGLQQHMRMHTGDKPYGCTFCPKAFTQKSGLEQHLRIHTKVRPYRCVICTKSFCQSIHLKQHMRTHTNVSPFQCGLCGKRFKQSSHLNYHLKCHDPAGMTPAQRDNYERLVGLMEGSARLALQREEQQQPSEPAHAQEAYGDGAYGEQTYGEETYGEETYGEETYGEETYGEEGEGTVEETVIMGEYAEEGEVA